eukprot:11162955-Lingulodinium_polyedra.AAC.1
MPQGARQSSVFGFASSHSDFGHVLDTRRARWVSQPSANAVSEFQRQKTIHRSVCLIVKERLKRSAREQDAKHAL